MLIMTKKLKGLNAKQKLFVNNLFSGMNKGEAALKAGCTPTSASSTATSWLKTPKIIQAIKDLDKKASEVIIVDKGLSTAFIVENFKKVLQVSSQIKTVQDKNGDDFEVMVDPANALKATENLAKHLGFFEVDNKQQNSAIQIVVRQDADAKNLKELAE